MPTNRGMKGWEGKMHRCIRKVCEQAACEEVKERCFRKVCEQGRVRKVRKHVLGKSVKRDI
jgi:hypothetical protein